MSGGYQFRAPTVEDVEAIAGVLLASDLDHGGESVLDAGFLRDQWSQPGFDLGADAWVTLDREGTLVAYGHAMREEPGIVGSWGVVHPEHRGRGIGSALLDRIEDRAGRLLARDPEARFRHAVDADDPAAASMLRARRLRLVRHFWHMGIDLAGPFDPGHAAPGVRVDPVDSGEDLRPVHAVIDEAFEDHWDHRGEPFDRWLEDHRSAPSFDPTLWLVARKGDQPVGALTAGIADGRGWVNELGVLASHRGGGIGEALLRRSFALFSRRGVDRVLLNVDAASLTGATALYERVGMRVVKRWDLWERSGV